jgi:hypothetical protein
MAKKKVKNGRYNYVADEEELERTFAAQVVNARIYAQRLTTAGIDQTAADQVGCALADLWNDSVPLGLDSRQVSEIANRYVEYDADGEAWPRDLGNVVPFGQR